MKIRASSLSFGMNRKKFYGNELKFIHIFRVAQIKCFSKEAKNASTAASPMLHCYAVAFSVKIFCFCIVSSQQDHA